MKNTFFLNLLFTDSRELMDFLANNLCLPWGLNASPIMYLWQWCVCTRVYIYIYIYIYICVCVCIYSRVLSYVCLRWRVDISVYKYKWKLQKYKLHTRTPHTYKVIRHIYMTRDIYHWLSADKIPQRASIYLHCFGIGSLSSRCHLAGIHLVPVRRYAR